MTAELEFEGKNVDKAVEQAAKTLKIPVEDIDYEIVSHGSTGIFGLAGVKKARIRVHNAVPHRHPLRAEMLPQPSPSEAATTSTMETDGVSHDATAVQSVGENVLRRMVAAISPEAEIVVAKEDQWLRFEVVGGQSGMLIGKRGQTLDAMQLIVERAVRRINGHDWRLQVDVEGYRAKKRAGLERAAFRIAQKVADKGVPSSLGYLSAQDRRTVHLALKEAPQVRTKSVGEGPLRKLMIYPRRRSKMRP